jgi:peroxiredoxin
LRDRPRHRGRAIHLPKRTTDRRLQEAFMQTTTALEVGAQAPEFQLRGPGGQKISLAEYKGRKNVVLVFFPFAFSSVCSHQLPAIDQLVPQFEQLGAVVLGISVDSHFSNTEFARRLRLSFPLLSDYHRATSAAYGVLIPEGGFSARAVFVVDTRGMVAYRDVNPNLSDLDTVPSNQKILDALKALQ